MTYGGNAVRHMGKKGGVGELKKWENRTCAVHPKEEARAACNFHLGVGVGVRKRGTMAGAQARRMEGEGTKRSAMTPMRVFSFRAKRLFVFVTHALLAR